ncbi:hypothetical protein PENNAL_c0009G09310 [Penicillium nalgiovense]|uniref:Uncharacterized protein n=1 Tax=Penicillium nalgiovense TaxID=60175 RepID=A0A1V6YW68_PENNA|nr:hypothetical protein PENNAL_c0009G09310 [Penicillium nalgiovense]
MQVSKINGLENGITLYNQVHVEFQAFKIALQPTENTNKYVLKNATDVSGTKPKHDTGSPNNMEAIHQWQLDLWGCPSSLSLDLVAIRAAMPRELRTVPITHLTNLNTTTQILLTTYNYAGHHIGKLLVQKPNSAKHSEWMSNLSFAYMRVASSDHTNEEKPQCTLSGLRGDIPEHITTVLQPICSSGYLLLFAALSGSEERPPRAWAKLTKKLEYNVPEQVTLEL